ncbi:DUF2489 domain-containing protein [Catenovulum sediminis]|uniref:DUF2489 domain-containing protein n=1 Tax=Catenovulum sediminis TaxID=1740262 RepID=A0ABV1RE02_9ALTE|nr:DUF2489 domain-containing protein [Catenovulum sediminis]
MSTTIITLLILAAAILGGLAFYAGKLLLQLKVQQTEIKNKLNQRNSRLEESIRTISQAMQEEQCEVGEGALRISVLLDHVSDATQAQYPKKYPSIHALNDKIKHLAILEERKKLPKKERMRQDFERMKAEAEYKDLVLAEAKKLSNFVAPRA